MRDLFKTKIIEPILRLKPDNVSFDDFLAIIFSLHSRIISTYFVNNKFKMPGIYLVNGVIATQGVGEQHRECKHRDQIVVRVDDHNPHEIHAEKAGHVFLLNRFEWSMIKSALKIKKGYEEV